MGLMGFSVRGRGSGFWVLGFRVKGFRVEVLGIGCLLWGLVIKEGTCGVVWFRA